MAVLNKSGFGPSFQEWIETVLKNQESRVISAGTTTSYCELQKGAHQGGPITTYVFIVALMILFYVIKTSSKIEGLNICEHSLLYSAYADDTTFFLKNVSSVIEIFAMIDYFPNYSGLKSNISKCEIAGTGALKRVHVAVCGLKPVDLTSDTQY